MTIEKVSFCKLGRCAERITSELGLIFKVAQKGKTCQRRPQALMSEHESERKIMLYRIQQRMPYFVKDDSE